MLRWVETLAIFGEVWTIAYGSLGKVFVGKLIMAIRLTFGRTTRYPLNVGLKY